MQVLINDCPVSFELGQEQHVSDIVNSVSEWSRERDLIFYELYIDQDRYAIDRVPDANLSGIKVINCIVQSKSDLVISSIDEAARYCDKASTFIKTVLDSGECTARDIADLMSGTTWLLEVLLKTMNLLGHGKDSFRYKDEDISHHIGIAEEFRDSLHTYDDSGRMMDYLAAHKDLFLDFKQIFKMLLLSEAMKSLVIQSVDSPDVLIASLVKLKDDFSPQLSNIRAAAIAYQTGRDHEGSERLKDFVDFIYRFTRTCYQIVPLFRIELSDVEVGGATLENKNSELRYLLHEVIAVMENNDIISLSDILEYEITPALKNLDKYIDLLLDKISCE